MPKKVWKKNDRFLDFVVKKSMPIEELQLKLVELEHEPSGASIIHLAADDPENLFCISFKTIPETSNGVAHILEHTVLCGSKKYPGKDPFFSMTRRSLNTFMNAMTGSDFTCYPASSQVPQDFYNLFDVYLDAVFFPNLKELSFLQEGIRLEFKDEANANTPLQFKGIVFNEMKGSLSNPSSRLHEAVMGGLFDEITYGINSGGDPSEIPNLTYKDLKAFHKKFYHPSRALFFFYGDMPLEKHLKFLQTKVLDDAKRVKPLPALQKQTRYEKPKRIRSFYPLGKDEQEEKQTYISFGWLTESIENQEMLLSIALLLVMLMDNDGSPLKMMLLKSGLIAQASAYMDTDLSEAPVVLTLQGCDAKNLAKIRKLVMDSLKEIYEKGLDPELIENAFHQFEFHRSEITGDSYPFGLALFMRSGLLKHHGIDPEIGLRIHSLIAAIRKSYKKNPRYFEELIQDYFIRNNHHVEVCMEPEKTLSEQEAEKEEKQLKKIRQKLTKKQIDEILEQAARLKKLQEEQNEKEADLLPKLSLKDVPKKMRDFELIKSDQLPLPIYSHTCFTNHITYADLSYKLPEIKQEHLFPLKILTYLLPQIGFNGKSYQESLNEIQANTGSLGMNTTLNVQADDFNRVHPTLILSAKALDRKADRMLAIMDEMTSHPDFKDHERIKEALIKHWASLKARFVSSSLKYAINQATSALSVPSFIYNQFNGLAYFQNMRNLMENKGSLDPLIKTLKQLHQQIFSIRPDLVLASDEKMLQTIKKKKLFGLFHHPLKQPKNAQWNYPLGKASYAAYPIASPVSFIAKAIRTISFTDPRAPFLALASSLFDNVYLHQKIREEGGAYGGGSSCYPLSGQLVFHSYRDPHIANTLTAFDEAVKLISKGKFSTQELEEAKLEGIQVLDAPVSPGSRSDIAYLWKQEGRTAAIRKRYRDTLLAATKNEIVEAVKDLVLPQMNQAPTVVFSSAELIEKENQLLKKPLHRMTI